MFQMRLSVLAMVLFLLSGCVSKKDFVRLEGKVDKLLLATNRSVLEQIFGPQSDAIATNVEKLNESQKQEFKSLQETYQKGQMTLEDVREKMLVMLGGGDREVYTPSGIVIRDTVGERIGAAPNGTKLMKCRKLESNEVPTPISEKEQLSKYTWGTGEMDGQAIVFPWELTISGFTKEIVESTARRTAEEFIRMGGEKQWNQPIMIKIETEGSENMKVTTGAEREIKVLGPDEKAPAP